jgi:hypothetical protein
MDKELQELWQEYQVAKAEYERQVREAIKKAKDSCRSALVEMEEVLAEYQARSKYLRGCSE